MFSEDHKHLVVGLGLRRVEGMSNLLLHTEVQMDMLPEQLFIPYEVAREFLVYQLSTVRTLEDGSKVEDHVLIEAPCPATLFSASLYLSPELHRVFAREMLRHDRDGDPRAPSPVLPYPLQMPELRKGDQIRLGVTNMCPSARNITGAFLVSLPPAPLWTFGRDPLAAISDDDLRKLVRDPLEKET